MASGTLYESGVVTLDGSGNGTVRLGPLTAREVWNPVTASVKTIQTTITNEAQCNIFVGNTATTENFRDNTFSGSSGDASSKISGRLSKGQFVYAVWTGGDAGAQARLVVSGTKDI